MKKPLLIGASALVLLASATLLFAQTTTGSSLITQMKAATHAFTLTADLNSGATGLESAPLVGKRTGDMLSAGEYNRILELIGQGGGGGGGFDIVDARSEWSAWPVGTTKFATCPSGYTGVFGITHYYRPISTGGNLYHGVGTCDWDSARTKCSATTVDAMISEGQVVASCIRGGSTGGGGGSGWVDVPLTDTNPFDQQCMYRFVTQGQTYYAETVHEDKLYWINSQHFTKANKSVLVFGTAPYNTATKMEKFCGGGGGGGGFNWDACTPEWVGTPKNGTPYTNAAGLKCKYTGASGPGALDSTYYLCCPGS